MCQPETETVPKHHRKLSLLVCTLCHSLVHGFLNVGGVGGSRVDGVSQLIQEGAGVPTIQYK